MRSSDHPKIRASILRVASIFFAALASCRVIGSPYRPSLIQYAVSGETMVICDTGTNDLIGLSLPDLNEKWSRENPISSRSIIIRNIRIGDENVL